MSKYNICGFDKEEELNKLHESDSYNIPDFDFDYFKTEINKGDILGLDYLEATLIRDYKDRLNDNYSFDSLDRYTWYEYIINLFEATKILNECVIIYEQSNVENVFNYDIYMETRNLLFKELGFDIDNIYN